MTRPLIAVLLTFAAIHAASPRQTPGNATPAAPGNTTPAAPGNVPPAVPILDPAAVTFETEVGLLLVAVKPLAVADYEAMIVALQEAMATTTDEELREIAKGWRVFKAGQTDAKANAIYVHLLQPTVTTADYRPSMLLDKLLAGAPLELLAKYRDSFAVPPTKLPLTEFANMTVKPVPKPSNTSPAGPTAPGKPGNASPDKPGNASPDKPGNTSPPKPPVR